MQSTVWLTRETEADPVLWDEMTRTIGTKVGATVAWMFQPGSSGPTSFATEGLTGAVVAAYAVNYRHADPLIREWQRPFLLDVTEGNLQADTAGKAAAVSL